jgi:hypothetical protein
MRDQSRKPQRRRTTRSRGRPLPWSNPTVGDVHGWLIEAFDNVADAACPGARRSQRAEDAVRFTGILLATWVDPEYSANASDREVQSIFWRSKGLLETLLDADRLSGSWSEQAHQLKAAEKLGGLLTMIMSYNVVSIVCAPDMIAGLRQAAVAAVRFSASAGAAAILEASSGASGGTDAAADAAQLACMLFRAADFHEQRLARFH